MSTKDFEKEFRKAEKIILEASEQAVRAVALQLFSTVIMRTPVGNTSLWKKQPTAGYSGGRLRGNWQTTLNAPANGTVSGKDKSGSSTSGKAKNALNKYTLDATAFLTNNLPYANRVEDGWSSQRPQGMVKTTVKQFKPLVDKFARKFKV